jgi:acetamidase/formamidase
VAVDLKISAVDAPNWIVSAYLPLAIFDDGRSVPHREQA